MRSRGEAVFRLPGPLRLALQRAGFAMLLLGCFGLAFATRGEAPIIERARMAVADAVAPVYAALSRPVTAINEASLAIRRFFTVYQDNARLRAELERAVQWQDAARRLEAENRELRTLLKFPADGSVGIASGRVIADASGAFMRSVLVSVGAREGVRKGQPVMTGEGLVGRVTEVGRTTARLLLITDLNSRIPVVVENSRLRAVLAGDNSGLPHLLYLSQDAHLQPGDRILTSGDGGTFPAGLPVGSVIAAAGRGPLVQPFADFNRLEYVRVLDYGLEAFSPPQLPPVRTRR